MNRKPSMTVRLVVAAVAVIAALLALGQLNPVARAQEATPTPEPAPGATRVRESDGAVMVYVPAGEFLMGSPVAEGNPSEWPQHIVYLDGYWIDRTEVTNRQFDTFVKATGYRTDAEEEEWGGTSDPASGGSPIPVDGADWLHPDGPDSSLDGRADYPVVQVSWNDGMAYCRWTDARLPTEAQWEKAARGTDQRVYPWGDDKPTCRYVVMWDDSGPSCGHGNKPSPVGSKREGASPYGVLDMAGNVEEWLADWYDERYYAQSPTDNPQGLETGSHVTRGGARGIPPRYPH